ncbi:MAG: mechanosensitive ion channel protein MscS [Proteobacteria bacterium SG_bin5]|nr:mechanosensitive ion channel family protein [Sphingomonas sp.]OQW42229.1 MAG: mechanosensitive ion channel protein MscS [Proteobacteria bacterium SG_bin5]
MPQVQNSLALPNLRLDAAKLYAESLFWLRNHWIEIAVAALVAVIAYVAIRAARRGAIALCARDRPGRLGWWRIAGRTLSRTGRFFAIAVALELARRIAVPPSGLSDGVHGLFIIAGVFQGALWARELILGIVEANARDDGYAGETLGSAINIVRVLVSFAVFAIALVVVLDNLGLNVTGLVAGLGIGGIAIGLAAQGIFGDLFAALAIIFDKPFRRGDVISFDQTTGTVEEIGLKSTRIRPPSGELHIIANKQLLDKSIQNITRRDHRRMRFVLSVTYQTPPELIDRLPDILREEVERCGQRFAQAGFTNFNASSLDVELEYDTPSPDFALWYRARHEVGVAILKRFAAEGIEFAYPTQTTFTAAPDGTMVMPYAVPGAPSST